MTLARTDISSTRPVTFGTCPVCTSSAPHFLRADGRDYFRCRACQAQFLDPAWHPSRDVEHKTYMHHENDPDDPRYRRFLSKLSDPLMARLLPKSQGLDYGCGPGPALAQMLREAGHDVSLFDPFFMPDPAPLNRTYDFVTCTEVVEHFHHPAKEFGRLRRLVRPGGWLAIMTCFQPDDGVFEKWHYRKDPTHVVFYRDDTFRYLANLWGWTCKIPVKDVALMQRPDEHA